MADVRVRMSPVVRGRHAVSWDEYFCHLRTAVELFLERLAPLELQPSKGETGVFYEPTGWVVTTEMVESLRSTLSCLQKIDQREANKVRRELHKELRKERAVVEMYERALVRIRDQDYGEGESPQTIARAAVPSVPE